MRTVHVVVPAGFADPARVSGGNRYDQQVCAGLRQAGWAVTEIPAPGSWPRPDAAALDALDRSLDGVGDDALVLVDGLIASAAGRVLVPRSGRLRLVVLVHMVFGGDAVPAEEERTVLAAARAVVATSDWTRCRLLDRYRLSPDRVHVAAPGTEPAPVSRGTADGGRLLCVGTLAPHKGQDVLLAALSLLPHELRWHCTLVGPVDRDPPFAASLLHRARGSADRLRITGPLTGAALQEEYRTADLLIVPSRAETYGMVVTEALATCLPVIASRVGGVPEALGDTEHGLPGVLVPVGDAAALAAALARGLTDGGRRARLRRAARRRRETLPDWRTTSSLIDTVLTAVPAEPPALRLRREQ